MRKNCVYLALAFALVAGVIAAEVQARGGGGGRRGGPSPRSEGERSEGNSRPTGEAQRSEPSRSFNNESRTPSNATNRVNSNVNRTPANAANRANTTVNRAPASAANRANTAGDRASQVRPNYGSDSRPFSSGWYADHPNAWQATHGFAGNWAAASLGATTSWLGMAALSDDDYTTGTVLTSDDGSDDGSDDSNDDSQSMAADESQPVQNAQNGEPQPAVATQLAASGNVVADNSSWLPLGVYSLKDGSQNEATAMLQLSVNKQGTLRGTYYDVVSDQGQAIQGAVDKKTRGVAWKVGANGPVIFETDLSNLTSDSGPVSLYFSNGQVRKWSLARLENPETQK